MYAETVIKEKVPTVPFEKRLGGSCRIWHGSPALKITKVSLEDRLKRGRDTEPYYLLEEDVPEEKTSLEKRLIQKSRKNPNRFKKEFLEKIPLDKRREQASKGFFLDPYAPKKMLELSRGELIDDILPTEAKNNFHLKSNLPLSDDPWATYGDVCCMLRDGWTSRAKDGNEFNIDYFSDEEYDLFLEMIKAGKTEAERWRKTKTEQTTSHPPFFPAYEMPLPQLFQAASEISRDEKQKEYFNTLYENKYKELLESNQDIRHFVEGAHEDQPEQSSSFCYVATAILVIIYAAHTKKIITLEEEMDMLYDIVIAPFLVDADEYPPVYEAVKSKTAD